MKLADVVRILALTSRFDREWEEDKRYPIALELLDLLADIDWSPNARKGASGDEGKALALIEAARSLREALPELTAAGHHSADTVRSALKWVSIDAARAVADICHRPGMTLESVIQEMGPEEVPF